MELVALSEGRRDGQGRPHSSDKEVRPKRAWAKRTRDTATRRLWRDHWKRVPGIVVIAA
jgi:hypothetical protein